jgi:hypothetical protein
MLSFKACEVHPSYYLHTIILITMLYIYIIFSEEIFNIQELLHRKSKRHETKPMHPSSLRAFQRDQERDLLRSNYQYIHLPAGFTKTLPFNPFLWKSRR